MAEAVVTRRLPSQFTRVAMMALCLGGWFLTQGMIGGRALKEGGIRDGLHELLAPLHRLLLDRPRELFHQRQAPTEVSVAGPRFQSAMAETPPSSVSTPRFASISVLRSYGLRLGGV